MIAYGHPPQAAWNYTPVQAEAFIWLAQKRRRRDRAQALSIAAMANRGDGKDINKRISKDWNAA